MIPSALPFDGGFFHIFRQEGSVLTIGMAIFLGLVQGISEFLPISSSGHLSIFQNLFKLGYSEEEHMLFDVMLHVGTLAAVFVFYWKDIKAMVKDTVGFISGNTADAGEEGRLKPSVRMVFLIILATLPLFLILPFNDSIGKLATNTPFISFALIVTGLLLFVSGKLIEGRKNEKTASLADVLVVGAAQAIATIPGLSRSGTTITVGLARGFKREFAVRFSFLMSIPAILGSALLTLIKAFSRGINWEYVPAYLIGMAVAAVVGYFALVLLKKLLVVGDSFSKFAYYCWGAGLLSLVLSLFIG